MNVTFERYMAGFEQSVERLPGILIDKWETLDDILCYEYKDQFVWLLETQQLAMEKSIEEGFDIIETKKRFKIANKKLFTLADLLLEKMNIQLEDYNLYGV